MLIKSCVYLYFVADLSEIDVNTFLGPFLDVIRSEDTTGPITGVALSSVNKFLSYGLVGMFRMSCLLCIQVQDGQMTSFHVVVFFHILSTYILSLAVLVANR